MTSRVYKGQKAAVSAPIVQKTLEAECNSRLRALNSTSKKALQSSPQCSHVDDPSGDGETSVVRGAPVRRTNVRRSNARENALNNASTESLQSSPLSPLESNPAASDNAPDISPTEPSGEDKRKVGPGFPPVEHQFKKGCGSPNPGGKKKIRGPEEIMAEMMAEKIMTPLGRMRAGTALCRSLRKRAFDPKDKYALTLLVQLWSKGATASQSNQEAKDTLVELRKVLPENHPFLKLVELLCPVASAVPPPDTPNKQTSPNQDIDTGKNASSKKKGDEEDA